MAQTRPKHFSGQVRLDLFERVESGSSDQMPIIKSKEKWRCDGSIRDQVIMDELVWL